MQPLFLGIDITSKDAALSETEFRELIAPSISYLDALSGAFEKKPCGVFFYPPDPDKNSKQWSARCATVIYVGKERREYLIELYRAIVNLIVLELPDCEVRAEGMTLNVS